MKTLNLKKSRMSLLVASLCVASGSVMAQAVPGGTLDPLEIPKYSTPLVIPPVMNDSGRDQGPNGTPGLGVGKEYDIAVRQFQQQILPGGIWKLLNPEIGATLPEFNPTTVWSYGPNQDELPDSSALGGGVGVAPAPNSQFNYPAYTVENTKDVRTTVNWINGLTSNAWNYATDTTGEETPGEALPHLLPIDQTLHWANPIADCYAGEPRTDCMGDNQQPYTGPVPMVAHLHGAHVGAAGDGYTESWWLPDADNISCVERDANGHVPPGATGFDGTDWNVVCEGTIANKLTNRNGAVVANTSNPDGNNPNPNATSAYGKGAAFYGYHNDQPSATLWFHDHSLGITRLNVYAGPAGFYLIREGDGGETGLANGNLPYPAPVAGEDLATTNFPADMGGEREKYREIAIAIQDRSFNADGSLFYPDNRAFFEGLNVEGTVEDGIAQFEDTAELSIPFGPGEPLPGSDECAHTPDNCVRDSDIAPIWNPEAFFNTMVVNGSTWPKLDVAPAVYRFRLLNGTNSRFLNLALPVTDGDTMAINQISAMKTFPQYEDNGKSKKAKAIPVDELRLWQIGAEQSLKPTVTAIRMGFHTNGLQRRLNGIVRNGPFTAETPAPGGPDQALLMGPAERADVLVDFRGLPNGTIVTMINTAPDAPFGGFPDVPADPATTGQVMRFVVNTDLLGTSPSDTVYADGLGRAGAHGRRVTYTDYFGRTRRMKNDKQATSAVLNAATAAADPWKIGVDPAALGNFAVAVNAPVRELALLEEESALVCIDIDGATGAMTWDPDSIPVEGACEDTATGQAAASVPMGPKAAVLGTVLPDGTPKATLWSDPTLTTHINADGVSNIEQWNLSNFSADAHPIHVHLVKFKVTGRELIGGGPSGIASGNGLQAWEDGWKDTVIAYPGEMTSLQADFDINGLYVWHCHILEHEDNEMMVPMCVGEFGTDCPAELM